jgi:hypothetical protein
VEASSVICKLDSRDLVVPVVVRKVMKLPCLMSSYRIDLALLSPRGRILQGIFRIQKGAPVKGSKKRVRANLKRLAALMMSALAYCQWGIRKVDGSKPIVGLLVYPTCLYRLSIWKPVDTCKQPFGYDHLIEMTDDPAMMAWVIECYLRNYAADYLLLKDKGQLVEDTMANELPHPRRWTALNFDLEKGLAPLNMPSYANHGFFVRTNAENLDRLFSQFSIHRVKATLLEKIASDEELIVKYISKLLVFPPIDSCTPIIKIIFAQLGNQRLGADDLKVRKKINNTEDQICSQTGGRRTRSGQCFDLQGTGAFDLGVQHPYKAVVEINGQHLLLIMRDVGESLSELMQNKSFLRNWSSNRTWRECFAFGVGESALNLVANVKLCHSDIRPQNIAVKMVGESEVHFCLIEYDKSKNTDSLSENSDYSRVLRNFTGTTPNKEASKGSLHSLAQIAFVVFAIECTSFPSEVVNLADFWLRNDKPKSKPSRKTVLKFEKWVMSKGSLVQALFSEENLYPAKMNMDYFMQLLYAILSLD